MVGIHVEEAPVLAAVVMDPGSPEVLQLREAPEPILGADDVLVEVRATVSSGSSAVAGTPSVQ